jgi:hypothetical protein
MKIEFRGGQLDKQRVVIVELPVPATYKHINAVNRTVEVYVLTELDGEQVYLYDPSLTRSAENW